jgi:hypothetical protein
MSTPVDRIHREASDIISHLNGANELSLALSAEDTLRKALLLSAASYFEHRLTTDVLNFVTEASGNHPLIPTLVKLKAINRQYHTWFDWEKSNANSFFSLFGDHFKTYMTFEISKNPDLSRNISSFLKIGSERNKLVHGDFASFSLSLTTDEIYSHYASGLDFVTSIHTHLTGCSAKHLSLG